MRRRAPAHRSGTVQVLDWLDLVDDTQTIMQGLNPTRHYIAEGVYTHAALQLCTENLDEADVFSFRSADMNASHTFHGQGCYWLSTRAPKPLDVRRTPRIAQANATLDLIAALTCVARRCEPATRSPSS